MEPILKHSDDRGFLVEFLQEDEHILNFKGQVYASTISPGDVRGNHYHTEKTEIFCVIKGKLKVLVQQVNSEKIDEYILNSDQDMLDRIMVLPNYAHAFINVGEEQAVLLAYGDKVHDHSGPDQYYFKISHESR